MYDMNYMIISSPPRVMYLVENLVGWPCYNMVCMQFFYAVIMVNVMFKNGHGTIWYVLPLRILLLNDHMTFSKITILEHLCLSGSK